MSRAEYVDPIEQVMFILGLKHDPKFETPLHAIAAGANPGIINALDQLTARGAIEANFALGIKAVQMVQEEFGQDIPVTHRNEIYQLIIDELDEGHSGGRWFENDQLPSDDWVNMAAYSPLFARDNTVFCLPVPYVMLLEPII